MFHRGQVSRITASPRAGRPVIVLATLVALALTTGCREQRAQHLSELALVPRTDVFDDVGFEIALPEGTTRSVPDPGRLRFVRRDGHHQVQVYVWRDDRPGLTAKTYEGMPAHSRRRNGAIDFGADGFAMTTRPTRSNDYFSITMMRPIPGRDAHLGAGIRIEDTGNGDMTNFEEAQRWAEAIATSFHVVPPP